VTADHAREAAALGRARDVDELADRERRGADRRADLELRERLGATGNSRSSSPASTPGFRQVAGLRLRHARCAPFSVRDLDGRIAVGLRGLDLRDAVVGHVEHRHRNGLAVIGEDARHADLPADKSHSHLRRPFHAPDCD
jgi:hypothetical protein